MLNQNENKYCHDPECPYGEKQHIHVITNNGNYVKFIVENKKPKSYD